MSMGKGVVLPCRDSHGSSGARLLQSTSTEGMGSVCSSRFKVHDLRGGRANVVCGLRCHYCTIFALLEAGFCGDVSGLVVVRHSTDHLIWLLDSNPVRCPLMRHDARGLRYRPGYGGHLISLDGPRGQDLSRRAVGSRITVDCTGGRWRR